MTLKKYFIAIVIPEPEFSLIEDIKQNLFKQYGLKGALRSPAHITIHRPFEWKEEKEGELIKKLDNFSFKESFEIELKNFDFFEPRVVFVNVMPNATLTNLHYNFKVFAKTELKLLNEWEDMRGFHPHITIANRDLKKPLFYELKERYCTMLFNGKFAAGPLCLLKLDKKWEICHVFNKIA